MKVHGMTYLGPQREQAMARRKCHHWAQVRVHQKDQELVREKATQIVQVLARGLLCCEGHII